MSVSEAGRPASTADAAAALRALVSSRSFRIALCAVGLVTAPLIVLRADVLDTTGVLTVLVPWSFVASGFIAWDRRPENRIGALLLGLGLWWTASRLMEPPTTSSSLVYTVGIVLRLAWTFGFVYVLLSFPRGRLSTTADRLIAGTVFVVSVPMQVAWLLFLPDEEPENALLVWPSQSVADAIDTAQRGIFLVAAVALVALLSWRWIAASPPVRRTLTPVLAGGITVLVFSAFIVVDKFRPVPLELQWAVLAAYTAVPVALLASILRARLARSAVGELVLELSTNPAPAQVRSALARALGDPSLRVAYWLPEYRTYSDFAGKPVLLQPQAGQALTPVRRGGVPVAALIHDASLRDEPELLDAVSAAAGIALENAQLHAELRARLEELKGSRARIVEAAQAERERLERDLHDGAQQRLVVLSLELGLLEERFHDDPQAKRQIDAARRELAQSLQELRELAHGIHPAALTAHGLAVALDTLVGRSPVPTRLIVDVQGRLPEAHEVAAYYIVAESLTNVAKYAAASAVTVHVGRSNGQLVVEVTDDGAGGATTSGGSGLRGLADRVEALGGRLRVWSPPGDGTRVRAEIPCES